MTMVPVVEFCEVTKRFGATVAVDRLSFPVYPGRIVGLLGRNGAGKTTSLRMLLGLTRPTAGRVSVFGGHYCDIPHAAHRVGVTMDGIGAVPGATGRRELAIWAKTLGVSDRRVSAVLDIVGLTASADKRVKSYSTGMKQRLALATALLTDPELLILDEPANGLDPDGIRWLRWILRSMAHEGRTILLSSHLLAEVEQTVDDVVILQQSLRYAGPLAELTGGGSARLEDRFFAVTEPAAPATFVRPGPPPVAVTDPPRRGRHAYSDGR